MGYNPVMRGRWLVMVWIMAGIPLSQAVAQDQSLPADAVEAHFQAILAEDYVTADQYFSAAFRRAFKAERRSEVDQYYLARREQLASGYQLLDTRMLADPKLTTAMVVVEFNDPRPDAFLSVTERMYYYLVYEKVEAGTPLADRDGRAWRIDIFDAMQHDTLAEARRRPYLYTSEAWPEDEGYQLKSLQGLFRIQDALERFYRDHGQYPFRLLGGDNRRDELIGAGYLLGRYPDNGYSDRAMRDREFGLKSSGDFAYYSVDADNDGWREGYWLLLHGKVATDFIYHGFDTVHILTNLASGVQSECAQQFMQFWAQRAGQSLELNPAWLPSDELPPPVVMPRQPARLPPSEAEPVVIGQPVEAAQQQEPVDVGPNAAGYAVPSILELRAEICGRALGLQIQQQLNTSGQQSTTASPELQEAAGAQQESGASPEPLTVYGFGW